MKIAYLNSQYPSLSHTFIEREIRAVRKTGIDIETFAIRKPDKQGQLGQHHSKAASETHYILSGMLSLLWSQLVGAVTKPIQYLRLQFISQRLSPPGLKKRALHIVYCLEAVKLAIRLNKLDIKHIHVHMANNSAMVALLACEYDKNLSYSLSIHGSAEFFDIHGMSLKEKIKNARFVRCISNFCKSQVMLCSSTDDWHKFPIVHCSVDERYFSPKSHSQKTTLRLVAVGRLVSIKGYPLLIHACSELLQEGINISLEIIGDGPQLNELKELIYKLDITDKVILSGAISQEEIVTHYKNSDVMVLSSFMEGVPVVLMEAMSCELAVIATNVGGVSELVNNGDCGILIPPANTEYLKQAIKILATDRNLVAEYGRKGRNIIEEEFTSKLLGNKMNDIFTKYIG